MNQFSALIFSDSYSDLKNELLYNRTLGSIPFGGRFRTVDFVLSSLVNAGVVNVAVITKKNYASLEDHLGGGKYWDLDHRNSGLRILSPFFRTTNNTEAFMARGKLDALRSVQTHIRSIREEYVVLTNSNIIANIDFNKVFDAHLNSGADITAVYANSVSRSGHDVILDMDETGRVRRIRHSDGDGDVKSLALSVYVLKRDLLMDIIKEADEYDSYSFDRHVLVKNVDTLNIQSYLHDGFAEMIYSVKDYYETSMKMLDGGVRKNIFTLDRPIMTRTKDSVPTLYHYNAKIENSIIADGCHIDGTVRNSIIFRNVKIEAGAVVENSIIMQNTVVGAGSKLNCVVLDKNTAISENKTLCGAEDYPYVFAKNSKV